MSRLPAARTTIAAGTAVRLVLAATTGLGIDESYAVAVNRPVAWSYFDHPPLVFWWSAAAEVITGSRHPFVVRLPFIAAFAATLVVLAAATRWAFGEAAARGAVLVASIAGVIGVTGATWVLPDGPMFLGLAIGAFGAARALVPSADGEPEDPSGWWWVGVGAGLAALAKYHAIFLPLGLLAYLVTTRRVAALRDWRPWGAALIAALLATPVFAWNAAHDWASFRFQSARAAPTGAWSPAPVLENLAGQAAWILPWVWPLLIVATWRVVRRGPRRDPAWLFACLGLGPLIVFTGSALLGRRGLPHWQAAGYLLLAPVAGACLAAAINAHRRWAMRWVRWAPAATVATALLLASQTATGWLRLPPASDPTRDAVPWDDAARALRAEGAPLAVTHWMDAAKLGAALGADVPLAVLADDARHFRFRPTPPMSAGTVIVRSGARGAWPADLQRRVGALDTLPPVLVRRGGAVVDTLYRYRTRQRPGV